MGQLKDLLFLLTMLQFSSVHSKKQYCPNSVCGNNTEFGIQYPFKKFEDQQPQNCNYTNIKCNSTQSISILDLPFSGEFYIRFIDYNSSIIQVYDPDNCLPRRLMNNLNLQGSPFVVSDYGYSTFYNCPQPVVGSEILAIDCLSNSTSAVVITFSISRQDMEGVYGCSLISTVKVPVSWVDSYDSEGINGNNLVLRWDVPACEGCRKDKGRWWRNFITNFFVIVFMIPVVAGLLMSVFICIACCLRVVDHFTRERPRTNQTTVARLMTLYSTTNTTGLDDSRIKSCSEMVVLDIDENQRTVLEISENLCCPICLEEYCDKEKVRRLSLCSHCFHADCIDQWLRNNCTCPTCRVSLSDVKL